MTISNEKDDGLPETEFHSKDLESKEKKLPYPKSVFFIVTNEFCERFSFYGMKAVLTLYLNNVLNFSEDMSTIIYHVFVMAAYFTPLIGAMLADALLGKFKTILYLSVVYAVGSIVLSLAATPVLPTDAAIPISMLGLGLIALGTGGIKPCVSAFGGDQFVLPQQAAEVVTFFSFFYMAINAGALISTFTTPIMRSDVQCFGEDSCYSLAFAVPAALMVVSIVIFVAGKFLYRETKPNGNVVVKVVNCISHAISRKRKAKADRAHWLDHADDTYEPRFIEDVKIVLRVLVLYLPLPVFWALYDQQGSRWTLQATRMNGVVGGYTIKPDQVQVLSALLILIFVPLFQYIIYPLLAKCNLLKKPLQRLTVGGILAGLAFVISGVLELQLEKTYPIRLAKNEASLNFINALPCPIELRLGDRETEILPNDSYVFEAIEAGTYHLHTGDLNDGNDKGIQMILSDQCDPNFTMTTPIDISVQKSDSELEEGDTEEAKQGGGFTYMVTFNTEHDIQLAYGDRSDDRAKPKEGNPKLRFLVGGDYFELNQDSVVPQGKLSVYIEGEGENLETVISRQREIPTTTNVGFSSETIEVEPIKYKLKLIYGGTSEENGTVVVEFIEEFELGLGGSYVISISRNGTYMDTNPLGDFNLPESYLVTLHTITEESSIHMFWLLPQYIVLTAGEIMFSVTGLEFSYSQSPVSMKSVMQSAWLMTVAFGNLIVVIIAELKFFQEQSKEFFLFAGLMFVDMVLFAYMAYRYVPAQLEDPTKIKDKQESSSDNS